MVSRRDFIRKGGMGMAMAAMPSLATRAFSSIPGPGNAPFKTGIAGYSFLKMSMAAAIALTRRLEVSFVTLKDFYLPLDSSPENARQIMSQFSDAGITVYGLGVIYMKTPQAVEQAFSYARNAGVDLIIGVPTPDLLDQAEQQVKQTGIRLAIHNHGPEDADYPGPREVFDRISHRDPRIGLCLDIGHSMRAGEDPVQAVRTYGNRIFDMHIKDVNAVGKGDHSEETGRGIIDFKGLVDALRKVKYSGKCSIEYEKDMTDPVPGISESVGYFRGVVTGSA